MPSEQVIEKLKNLQTELETVSVAVKHIDEAAKVADTAAEILKKIPELLTELKSVEEKHRENLQKDFKGKIEVIRKQLQSLLDELNDKTKQLNQVIEEIKKLERSISDYYAEIKKINFPERLDKIDNQISSINIGIGNLQSAIQISQTKIDLVYSALNEVKQSIEKKLTDNQRLLIQRLNHQDKEIKLLKILLFFIGGLVLIGFIAIIFKN